MIKRRHVLMLDGLFVLLIPACKVITGWMLEKGTTPCYYWQFNLQCPACGGTRCLYNIASGEFLNAFWLNPYVFCTVVLSVGILILMNVAVFCMKEQGQKLLKYILRTKWLIVWAVGFAVFGILRNINLLF